MNNQPSFRDVYQTAEYVEGDTSWHTQAACTTADTAIFYPAQGSGHKKDWAAAKAICDDCPVKQPCLQYAMRTKQEDGLWGGLTPTQRRSLRTVGSQAPCPTCDGTYTRNGSIDRCNNCRTQQRAAYVQAHRHYSYLNKGA